MEVAHPASTVAVVDAEDFNDGMVIDQATLASLQAIYPMDFPGQPIFDDEGLTRHLAQMPGNDLAGLQPDGFHNPSTVLLNLDCVDLGLYGDIFNLACANLGEPQRCDSVTASDSIGGFNEPPAGSASIRELAIVGVGGLDVSEVSVTTER